MTTCSPSSPHLKRTLDLALVTLGLGLVVPLGASTALAIRLNMGSPVFYRQTRLGYLNRPFRLWKFRTMTNERGPDGQLLPDAERLTRLGRFLRETSLDELPQLLNVLAGDMSIVGPRPLLTRYLQRYSDTQRKRHNVRPGITGYAQVNGRNALDWESRLELDVWYAENQTLWLDLKILAKTAILVQC
jgi:sugar transferase EpsL